VRSKSVDVPARTIEPLPAQSHPRLCQKKKSLPCLFLSLTHASRLILFSNQSGHGRAPWGTLECPVPPASTGGLRQRSAATARQGRQGDPLLPFHPTAFTEESRITTPSSPLFSCRPSPHSVPRQNARTSMSSLGRREERESNGCGGWQPPGVVLP
jgi:hypothetical protein